ncbi:MAG TPA: ATP-binding protein [Dermatophilaceae bacterium]|nr:ATP-binding protein [Dermatophilaceae bacterium]
MAGERRAVGRGQVRVRTTAAATLVMAAALTAGGWALLSVLSSSLQHDVDQLAELHAADIAVAASQSSLRLPVPADDDEAVQVVDAQGRVVAASANASAAPPLGEAVRPGTGPVLSTLTDPVGLPGRFRLFSTSTQHPPGGTIHVATSLKLADQTQDQLRVALLLGAPALLLLVTGSTWVVAGRTLAPVEAIRATVSELSAADLSARVPVPAGDDEISRLASTMNAMLDRLQAAAERERRFVADASHELRTPLAAMRADLEVGLAHHGPGADRLLARTDAMQRLVDDLLFVARSDSGRPRPPARPLDLHELVAEQVASLPLASGVRVDADQVQPAFVAGRPDDLRRAVANLLDNAVRHARRLVRVQLGTDGDLVTLVVEDDGPGIAPADRERVLQRFTRLDQARSSDTGGTGLGLAIAAEIAAAHDGRLRVTEGSAGARLELTLPAG